MISIFNTVKLQKDIGIYNLIYKKCPLMRAGIDQAILYSVSFFSLSLIKSK